MSNHYKYLETSKRSKAAWAARNKERINAKRRERRKKATLQRLKGTKCLNCEIYITERSLKPKRVRLYCEECVRYYPIEVRRHRWRRYYYRKKRVVS